MTVSRTMVFTNFTEPPAEAAAAAAHSREPAAPGMTSRRCCGRFGLRPTRQRMALGWILFGKGDRHVTAEMLYEESLQGKVPVSLATVYNTLHQFHRRRVLRQSPSMLEAYSDHQQYQHHHFFVEGENALLDIPDSAVIVEESPIPPEGYEIARIDVVVRPASQRPLRVQRSESYRGCRDRGMSRVRLHRGMKLRRRQDVAERAPNSGIVPFAHRQPFEA